MTNETVSMRVRTVGSLILSILAAGALAACTRSADTDATADRAVAVDREVSAEREVPVDRKVPTDQPEEWFSSDDFYGPGIASNGLANTAIKTNEYASAFVPPRDGQITAFRKYFIHEDGGYGAGTGGRLLFQVRPADGSGLPSDTVLAETVVEAPRQNDLLFELITLDSAASVQANGLYFLTVRNIDSNPDANFASMDDLKRASGPGVLPVYNHRGDGWKQPTEDNMTRTPIQEFVYDTGESFGSGYIHGMPHDQHLRSIGGTNRVRQLFTVSGGSRQVDTLSVYLTQTTGDGRIDVELQQGGTVIASASSSGPHDPDGYEAGRGWIHFALPTQLSDGVAYELVLSAPSGNSFYAMPLRDGSSSYGWGQGSVFSDGHAQYSTGSDWQDWPMWDKPGTDADLMFYLS